MALTWLAHTDIEERVKGVWRFGMKYPGCYYPMDQRGQLDQEWGELLIDSATGSESTTEEVVEALVYSSAMHDRWIPIDNPQGLDLKRLFESVATR